MDHDSCLTMDPSRKTQLSNATSDNIPNSGLDEDVGVIEMHWSVRSQHTCKKNIVFVSLLKCSIMKKQHDGGFVYHDFFANL